MHSCLPECCSIVQLFGAGIRGKTALSQQGFKPEKYTFHCTLPRTPQSLNLHTVMDRLTLRLPHTFRLLKHIFSTQKCCPDRFWTITHFLDAVTQSHLLHGSSDSWPEIPGTVVTQVQVNCAVVAHETNTCRELQHWFPPSHTVDMRGSVQSESGYQHAGNPRQKTRQCWVSHTTETHTTLATQSLLKQSTCCSHVSCLDLISLWFSYHRF